MPLTSAKAKDACIGMDANRWHLHACARLVVRIVLRSIVAEGNLNLLIASSEGSTDGLQHICGTLLPLLAPALRESIL